MIKDKMRRDENDFHIIDGVFASSSVLEYSTTDGRKVKIFVPEQVLADAASAIQVLPVTLLHPDSSLVKPETYKELTVGHVLGTPALVDGKLIGQVAVCDAEAIEAVKEGMTDLSMGYRPQISFSPGVFVDKYGVMGDVGLEYPYEYEYTMISYNHIALVPEGRSVAAELILDNSNTPITYTCSNVIKPPLEDSPMMKTIVLDGGKTVEISKDSESVLLDMLKYQQDMKQQMADMKTSYDNLKSQLEALQGSMDATMAEKEKAEAMVDGLKSAIEELKSAPPEEKIVADSVYARLNAWQEIGGIENGIVSFDASLSPIEIKRQYLLKTVQDSSKLALITDGEDGFIEGVFFGTPKNKSVKAVFAQHDAAPQAPKPSSIGKWDSSGGWSIR